MMATNISDNSRLYKFTKVLTLKVVQIVVQSRQGKQITHSSTATKCVEYSSQSSTSEVDWFNLSIPDEPQIETDAKNVLNGEVVTALANVLCVEISLHTNDGDEMVLELWTVKMIPGCDSTLSSVSTIYYRMSIMLKSTLSISRITPAYKMSRMQNKESYKISHKIYGGQPNFELLGDKHKAIKVSELRTPIGTIMIEVNYRTKMTILPEDKQRNTHVEEYDIQKNMAVNDIMVKSDHFKFSPKKDPGKKNLDLTKPLTAGAFVDTDKIKELHFTLSQQLLPEPPMTWLIAEKDKSENIKKQGVNIVRTGCNNSTTSSSAPSTSSTAIEVPKSKNKEKYSSLMDFPFADGSPIAELANFYQECLQARSISEEWSDGPVETASTDSDTLSKQLKVCEEAVSEFDNMVASMFISSENGSEHS